VFRVVSRSEWPNSACAVGAVACGDDLEIRVAAQRKCGKATTDQLRFALLWRCGENQAWGAFGLDVREEGVKLIGYELVKPSRAVFGESALGEGQQSAARPLIPNLVPRW
jgi:hypothetical protein